MSGLPSPLKSHLKGVNRSGSGISRPETDGALTVAEPYGDELAVVSGDHVQFPIAIDIPYRDCSRIGLEGTGSGQTEGRSTDRRARNHRKNQENEAHVG
jgi:hypothetical protein